MLYIIEDKNLEMLRSYELTEDDSLLIFVKDMEKPTFTGIDVQMMLQLKAKTELLSAGTRDEMVFAVGGKVFTGFACTLIQLDIPIPDMFKESVTVVQKQVKKSPARRTTSGRKSSTKPKVPVVSQEKAPETKEELDDADKGSD